MLPRANPPGIITFVSLLIVVEAAGLIGGGLVYLFARGPGLNFTPDDLITQSPRLLASSLFIVLGMTAGVMAVGCAHLHPRAWLGAVGVQGLVLLTALLLYLVRQPWYDYLVMAYSIFLVIYLHHTDVQAAFRPPAAPILDPRDAG